MLLRVHAPLQNYESEEEPIYNPITVLLYILSIPPALVYSDSNASLQGVDT